MHNYKGHRNNILCLFKTIRSIKCLCFKYGLCRGSVLPCSKLYPVHIRCAMCDEWLKCDLLHWCVF